MNAWKVYLDSNDSIAIAKEAKTVQIPLSELNGRSKIDVITQVAVRAIRSGLGPPPQEIMDQLVGMLPWG